MFYSIKEKGSLKNSMLYSIGIIFSLLSFNAAQALYEGRYGKPLDISRYNMISIAGSVAFSAKNPKRPAQNIIFVPSIHILNLRFLDSAIVADMKAADILIGETSIAKYEPEILSWDSTRVIGSVFKLFSIDRLTQSGLLKDTPFLNPAGTPWTFYLKPETKNFLTQNFQPEKTLNLLSPAVVHHVMYRAAAIEANRLGMDSMIQKHFILNNKPILDLDARAPITISSTYDQSIYDRLKKMPMNVSLIEGIDQYVENFMNVSKRSPAQQARVAGIVNKAIRDIETPETLKSEHSSVIERNILWIPKLLNYFDDYPDKKIVVVVGAGHFHGPQGFLKLLEAKGFKFTEGP